MPTITYTNAPDPASDHYDLSEHDDNTARDFGSDISAHMDATRSQWSELDQLSGVMPDEAALWFRENYELAFMEAAYDIGTSCGTLGAQLDAIEALTEEKLRIRFEQAYGEAFTEEMERREMEMQEFITKFRRGWHTPETISRITTDCRAALYPSDETTLEDAIRALLPDFVAQWDAALSDCHCSADGAQLLADEAERVRKRAEQIARVSAAMWADFQKPLIREEMRNPRATDRVLSFDLKSPGRGIILTGDTGRGKTRAACALLMRHAMQCEEVPFALWSAEQLRLV